MKQAQAYLPLSPEPHAPRTQDSHRSFTVVSAENVVPIFPGLHSRRGTGQPVRGVRQSRDRAYLYGAAAGASNGRRGTPDALRSDRISLSVLRFFMAVYASGKMSRVAAELKVTTSTVSTSIARLAQMFDCELFRSTGRGLVPTESAHQLAPRVREILRLWDGVLGDMRATAPGVAMPDLEIACPEYLLTMLTRLQGEPLPMDLVVRHVLPTWEEMQRLYDTQGAAALMIVDHRETVPWDSEQHVIARFTRRWLVARRGHPVLGETPTLAAAYDCRWIGIEGTAPRGTGEGRLSLESWSSLGQLLQDSDQVCFCSDIAAHYLVSEHGLEAYLMPEDEHERCELRLMFSGEACPPVVRRWLMQVLLPAMERWVAIVLDVMGRPVAPRRVLRGSRPEQAGC
ncbi:LysR family transcriptional regulator [Imbroritus primus]|uniref:LysR family transcriptional regulator n=1 Tax=Imbroritus primus TaxID=3058603 RepID=A0ACD3SLB5_9BURK|nr:LysR family transcriptional regulator [Burkholderiaceae bacterium PBA]